MALDYATLRNWQIPDIERSYTERDTILYALGIGVGSDPCDDRQLQFLLEDRLRALPSMAVVLAYPPMWYWHEGTTVDPTKVVHAEQGFVMHRPLPVAGKVLGKTRVTGIVDKGTAVGALMRTECEVLDQSDGGLICTVSSASMARGDGGFGNGDREPLRSYQEPERPPDAEIVIPTLPQAALIYRLSGDTNPLHADPAHARRAGFERPILHGRCSFGIAAWSLIQALCPDQPERLVAMSARFARPVMPGETLVTRIWKHDTKLWFHTLVAGRGTMVLTRGEAVLGDWESPLLAGGRHA
jgi:acyl dehydratase